MSPVLEENAGHRAVPAHRVKTGETKVMAVVVWTDRMVKTFMSGREDRVVPRAIRDAKNLASLEQKAPVAIRVPPGVQGPHGERDQGDEVVAGIRRGQG
ncbi:hypothetical protein TPAR_04342 [Tolypocladium paradoxum]|uniref:Uncharacterized protein n=1 Tax=Tolypocladium paradoxum TaxID=94208 RepID=A0A2S4KZ47_9HYPO|nr:hypothetical protein TPAR_04342 [Tolypocladium paradoxum]